jgi:hypothetical protein
MHGSIGHHLLVALLICILAIALRVRGGNHVKPTVVRAFKPTFVMSAFISAINALRG